MPIASKLLSLRACLACFLVVIVLLNVTAIAFHNPSTALVDAKQSIEHKLDHLFSDEYLKELKEDLKTSRKEELLAELKKELKSEYETELKEELKASRKEELLAELKNELKGQYEKEFVDSLEDETRKGKDKLTKELKDEFTRTDKDKLTNEYKADLRRTINDKYTGEYFSTRVKNYNLLEELRLKYFQENTEAIKDLEVMSLLNIVLEGETDNNAAGLKLKVADEIKKKMSLSSWLSFALTDVIEAHAPKTAAVTDEEKENRIRNCHRVIHHVFYDKEYLSRVKLPKEKFDDLKSQHAKLTKYLRSMDVPPADLFLGEGIVISGGGEYFAGAMVTIIQLREAGSTLPIELMLDTRDEYDESVCNEMETKFNAKCVVVRDFISEDISKRLNLSKFQLKIMGLLVSSFDHVISIDADNMALINPDLILTSDAYLETKFLLWPDLWQRTISPTYYDIAGVVPGEVTKRNALKNGDDFSAYAQRPWDKVHFHDLDNLPDAVSTETGQMAFSKREHFRSFLLAVYYNVYGVSHYWPMFYQGSPGSGDRDTFVPALHALNEPYHVVQQATWLAGFREESGRFQETTIVQYDPTSTSQFVAEWKEWLRSKGKDSREMAYQESDTARDSLKQMKDELKDKMPQLPQVQFLHVHRPKLNPVLMTDPKGYFDCFKQRNLDHPGYYKESFGDSDWELRFNSIVQWVACKGINSEDWWKSVNREQTKVCEEVTKYVHFLKEGTNDPNAQEFKTIKF